MPMSNAHAHDAHPAHAGGCAASVRDCEGGCAGRWAIPRVNAGDAHLLVWGRGCGRFDVGWRGFAFDGVTRPFAYACGFGA